MKRLLSHLLLAGVLSTTLLTGAAQARQPLRCPEPKAKDAAAAHAEARRLVDAARDGEHYRAAPMKKALAALRKAAAAGSLEAQAELGKLSFSLAFQGAAPTPRDRARYVEALTWLAVAAHRGDPAAKAFFPEALTASLLDPQVPWQPDADPAAGPFAALPPAWVTEAAQQARKWQPCFPAPCAFDADDPSTWAACDGRSVTVQARLTPPERVTNHPLMVPPPSAPVPTMHQMYADVGTVQLIVLTPTLLNCAGPMTLTGTLGSVEAPRGPAMYRGWSLHVSEARCLE